MRVVLGVTTSLMAAFWTSMHCFACFLNRLNNGGAEAKAVLRGFTKTATERAPTRGRPSAGSRGF